MKISIITPSFRPGSWLRYCISSVADQEGGEIEHLVQDAGSDDGTLEWLPHDPHVQSFIEKDDGMYDAINRGLSRAGGDICAWLNCDEQYLPGALARVEHFFSEHPETDVLFGDAILIDSAGAILSYRRAVLPQRAHVRYVHLNTLSCATFFRRRIFEQGHWFDPRWKAIGDAVWMEGLLAAGKKMAVIPEPLATFAFTGENLSASYKAQQEARRWRGRDWRSATAPLLSVMHRFRKWRAGAYQRRDLTVSIYTPDSPDRRKEVKALDVGYGWPKDGGSQGR